ncbi:MAG: UDP-N-acetylglucosamine--N-acetylmuramyl-(pentapeptide) pyrophosphoryl-undecaprenol N-acetylglucosamine transferase [Actinobacteria bacterium]|nr:UDP-N-acetylglucosamine--N-acetylmuramyl-(pentapeptide) pyrophosphoryl-undecaprenol N-acetylglucosamine transferase [Actinomycetota bacterium]
MIPALAVADALRARDAEVSFITTRDRSGTGLPSRNGYEEHSVPLRGFERRFTPRNLLVLGRALLAVPRALWALRRARAGVVLTAGGYLAGPVAIAARLRRTPVVAMEADSRLGLANRLIAPLARTVALAWPLPGRTGSRYVVVGRPVRAAVTSATRTAGRRALGLPPEATVVLIVGGSQGARTLNVAAVDAFGEDPPFEVIHVTGPGQFDEVQSALARVGRHDRYRIEPYLDDLHNAIAAADLVVSRSGGSVFELAALGRASILVPYPFATADHQTRNARWLADAGAAVLLTDAECTGPQLRSLVGALLADRSRLDHMGKTALELAKPDAADRVADAVMAAAEA